MSDYLRIAKADLEIQRNDAFFHGAAAGYEHDLWQPAPPGSAAGIFNAESKKRVKLDSK